MKKYKCNVCQDKGYVVIPHPVTGNQKIEEKGYLFGIIPITITHLFRFPLIVKEVNPCPADCNETKKYKK